MYGILELSSDYVYYWEFKEYRNQNIIDNNVSTNTL